MPSRYLLSLYFALFFFFFACLQAGFKQSFGQEKVVTGTPDLHPLSLAHQYKKNQSFSIMIMIMISYYFNANPREVFTLPYLADVLIPQAMPGSDNVIDCHTRITWSRGKLYKSTSKKQTESTLGKQIISALAFTRQRVN